MGRKKGKGKSSEEKWDEGEEGAAAGLDDMSKAETGGENPVGSSSRGAGKKGKAKRKNFEDLDEEMEAIAAEMGLDVEGSSKEGGGGGAGDKISAEITSDDVTTKPANQGAAGGNEGEGGKDMEEKKENNSRGANKQPTTGGGGGGGGGGKKSKKKKKKGDIDDEELESMLREIEGDGAASSAVQTTPALDTQDSVTKESGEATEEATATGGGEGEGEGEGSTVMTAAQKKAAKKEREKKKKEAARQAKLAQQTKQQERTTTTSEQGGAKAEEKTTAAKDTREDQADDEEQVKSKVEDVKAEGEGGGEGEEDTHTEEKKKKKKKKKKEEEKPKGKTPGKAAISKIKKLKAALEEEQRRREEEALAAQREEEERERKRLEQLQLEKEKKERIKQKEKERKARRKLEGKPVTKKEREAEQRRQAHLESLRQQGISVPEKRAAPTDEQGKKKVMYVSRQRKNKKKQDESSSQAQSMEIADTHEDSSTTKQSEAELEEDVPDRWDDDEEEEGGGAEADEEEHVKANWDDESEGEEEITSSKAAKSASPVEGGDGKPSEGEPEEEGEGEEEGSSSSSDSEEDESESEEDISPFEKVKRRIQKRRERYEAERSEDTLRSPVVCVLGHVDTGKTKILDKIRRSNVQDGEAGGITQQIGATFVPQEAIQEQTKMVKEFAKTEIKVPGLLIIDTPGHESFSNLRSRGSSMCDIAILVVDIMHGLEPQTLESLNILRKGKTPFIVALNKIDRMYDWQRNPSGSVRDTLKRQKTNTKSEFEERTKQTIAEFAEQGLNAALFWEKVDFKEYIPMVPTSAITGDGMGDLIALLVSFSLKMLTKQLMLSMELEALVLEVKVIAGLGTTIDVILRNGVLREGDTLVLTGTEGPFATTVRALLMPQPLRELRVKNAYVQHKAVLAAQGVKVTSKGELEKTLAGTPVLVAKKSDEIDILKTEAAEIMKSALSSIKLQERGVYVQASTLGSLEALLEFLKQSKIPYCGVSIGPVHKKDVMKASVMLEHDNQWAVILAFDVRVERDAQEMADSLGVKIFSADIIYHLFDAFLNHRKELLERKRREFEHIAVFPCKLRIMPNCIFNTRDPIVMGVVVEAGIVKAGTPLTIPSKSFTDIGVVSSIEVNHKVVGMARSGEEVCIKVEHSGGDAPRLYGRHFDHTDTLVSKISRESIDAVKNYFREDLQRSDWQLIIELKKIFQII